MDIKQEIKYDIKDDIDGVKSEQTTDDEFDACISKYFDATFAFRRDSSSDSSSGLDYDTDSMDEWREISRHLDDDSSEEDFEMQTEAEVVQPRQPRASKTKAQFKKACKKCHRVFRSEHKLKRHMTEHKEQAAWEKQCLKKKKVAEYRIASQRIDKKIKATDKSSAKKKPIVPPPVQPIRLERIKGSKSQPKWRPEQQEKFECGVCRRYFRQFNDMLQHLRLKHPDSAELSAAELEFKKKRTCRKCGKVFLKPCLYKKHAEKCLKMPIRASEAADRHELSSSNDAGASKSDDFMESNENMVDDDNSAGFSTDIATCSSRICAVSSGINLQKQTSDVQSFSEVFQNFICETEIAQSQSIAGRVAENHLRRMISSSFGSQDPEAVVDLVSDDHDSQDSFINPSSDHEGSSSKQHSEVEDMWRKLHSGSESPNQSPATEEAPNESISSAYCSNDSSADKSVDESISTKSDETGDGNLNSSGVSTENELKIFKVYSADGTYFLLEPASDDPVFRDPFLALCESHQAEGIETEGRQTTVETVAESHSANNKSASEENQESPPVVELDSNEDHESDDSLHRSLSEDNPTSPMEGAQHESCSNSTASSVIMSDFELSATDSDENSNAAQHSSRGATDDERACGLKILEVRGAAHLQDRASFSQSDEATSTILDCLNGNSGEEEMEADEGASFEVNNEGIDINNESESIEVDNEREFSVVDNEHPRFKANFKFHNSRDSQDVIPASSDDYDSDDSRAR